MFPFTLPMILRFSGSISVSIKGPIGENESDDLLNFMRMLTLGFDPINSIVI